MSLDDFDDVPDEKSPASIRATRMPRAAASRATPAPVMPPPMTVRSNDSVRSASRATERTKGRGVGAAGSTPTGYDPVR